MNIIFSHTKLTNNIFSRRTSPNKHAGAAREWNMGVARRVHMHACMPGPAPGRKAAAAPARQSPGGAPPFRSALPAPGAIDRFGTARSGTGTVVPPMHGADCREALEPRTRLNHGCVCVFWPASLAISKRSPSFHQTKVFSCIV